jgi:HlyD family secretion protein
MDPASNRRAQGEEAVAERARGRWRSLFKSLGIAVGAAGLAGLIFLGLTWELRGEPVASEGREVVPVVLGSLRETVVATGVTEPGARVIVQSEISGIIARIHVEEGNRVERGQPLVELDQQTLEDRVAIQSASLRLRRALAGMDLVSNARVRLDKAEQDFRRTQQLFEKGVASTARLDEARYALEMAQLALSDAHAEHEARLAGVSEAENMLRRAERDLTKAVIRAPIDGVVVSRPVEVGTAVGGLEVGGMVTIIAELANDERIHVLAKIDENDIARVRVGQSADVRIDAFPDEVFSGVVRKVSLAGIRAQGLSDFDVEIEIDADERIRVGMSADARIVVGEHENVLLVPNLAIHRTGEGPQVERVRGKEGFERVPIRTAYSDGFQTIVSSGLQQDDLVMVADKAQRHGPADL